MIRLPISGMRVTPKAATGHDDLALADSRPGLSGALAYLDRTVVDDAASPLDSGQLPVGDVDLFVVARRRQVLGDRLVAEGICARCTAAVDVQFSLAAYAGHHAPRAPRNVTALTDEPGWWQLKAGSASGTVPATVFRVPVAADVLAVSSSGDPRAELLQRCVRDGSAVGGAGRTARTIEQAMATLAPTLRADVSGGCPECGSDVILDVDARELCLAELRFLAEGVYDDAHLIASAYGWVEDDILDLPSARRRRYADLIAGRSDFVVPIEGVPVG
jgi:hypothetical protein